MPKLLSITLPITRSVPFGPSFKEEVQVYGSKQNGHWILTALNKNHRAIQLTLPEQSEAEDSLNAIAELFD